MSFLASPDVDLTENQIARRRRVLDAVLELVADGRVDDIQMKDVADRSGVALGTMYRYFASKDHLFAAALVEWVRRFTDRATRGARPPARDGGASPAERLTAVLRRGMRPFEAQPAFARLMHLVSNSTDPFAGACALEISDLVSGTMSAALPDIDPAHRERIIRVVVAVWSLGFAEWVVGRLTIRQMHERLADACDLLLP